MQQNLIAICGIAFAAVFTLLSFLAIVMQIITIVFKEKSATLDSAIVAAISDTVSTLIPGARVTRIEEKK